MRVQTPNEREVFCDGKPLEDAGHVRHRLQLGDGSRIDSTEHDGYARKQAISPCEQEAQRAIVAGDDDVGRKARVLVAIHFRQQVEILLVVDHAPSIHELDVQVLGGKLGEVIADPAH
jgi:hypothetical protein